jgi:3',5'-nucleoside bisphosphate phosphatase
VIVGEGALRLTAVRIDLHVHSTASDGTVTPTQLMQHAAASGIDVVGLTDHDSPAGWAEAGEAARATGVILVPGMEISTKLAGAGVHLLAYLPDPTYPPLAAELDRILAGREGRLAAIVEGLRAAGVDISVEDIRRQAAGTPAVGRPHVADVLVAKGVVVDRAEAFRGWLGYGQAGFVVRYATPTDEMVRLVVQAGGAAVVAHPWGRGSRRVLDLDTLADLRDAGLTGVEVDHQDHSADDRGRLRGVARELGLVATGASDFHGAGKVDHELGCNLTEPQEYERLLAAAAANAEQADAEAGGLTVAEVVGP